MITIGFIGTGLMGLPMAKNILKSGFKLKAFNRSIEKAEPLKEFGAEISKSISDVVKDSDFIITMLTDDSAVDAITSSTDFLDNLKSGSTVIDMSSVKPTTATKYGNSLKSKNINYLDAPVSGGTIGAEEASLAIMVGGEQSVFDISAPNSFIGSALLIERLNAFSLKPDFNKFIAIGRPIRPVPIKPIFIMVSV